MSGRSSSASIRSATRRRRCSATCSNLFGTTAAGLPPIGVTGTHAQLHELIARYGADYERDPAPAGSAYTVTHPTSLYVIDPAGRLRAIVSSSEGVDPLVAALRQVL